MLLCSHGDRTGILYLFQDLCGTAAGLHMWWQACCYKCPHFYNLANGYFEKYSRNVSYVMNFNCDEGYHLEGSRISTCMRSENNVTYWTNPLPKCVRGMIVVTCQPLPQQYGKCVAPTLTAGSEVHCFCDFGYRMVGNWMGTCLKTGAWSNSNVTCVPKKCPPLRQLANGKCQETGHTFGSKRSCFCNTGYTILGSPSGTCLDSEKWNNSDIVCAPDALLSLNCSNTLEPVLNGYVSYSKTDFTLGTTASFLCHGGYVINGTATLLCTLEGSTAVWSHKPPTCDIKSCPVLSQPLNCNLSSFDNHYGVSVTYNCHWGFQLRYGSKTRMCQSSGQWSGTEPYCQHGCAESNCRVTEECVIDSNGQGVCECLPKSQCPSDYTPVCGTNGVQENNKCLLKVKSCHSHEHDVDIAANDTCEFGGVCSLSIPSAPSGITCRATVYRFWFNSTSQQCERYEHGNCLEGHNTFFTEVDCAQKCIQTDVCNLPYDAGKCNYLNEERYFFNTTTQRCESFTYGGCFGNENNFLKEQQCKEKCTCVSPHTLAVALSRRDAVVLVRVSSARKEKNGDVSYTVKVAAMCSSAQGVSIPVDATKTSLLVVESTQGRLQCPQFVKGKTYGVAVNVVSSSADLLELRVNKSFYVEEATVCPS
ncbi:sushi, von Willebrand factor type A, EGF and pentraxin domain-containing protein 1-like isoform X2 [Corticium candelabrum]|uniref:sushi, von Willebrand factor type A, EGF and pentraxin domain-containing protein 1-like isoform X2 n=1 Tax=Corticium candelabrum TaxID=121492 RepID=UPI002E272C38|nr:sushi, von Willebrand factor type A, EGF and pentraxin domain-containing protein 1-like isoform X2 [Corticium candelabrum]